MIWVIRGVFAYSSKTRVIFNLIGLVVLSWFKHLNRVKVDFIPVIILLLVDNFHINSLWLITVLWLNCLLYCVDIYCTSLEQLQQLCDLSDHTHVLTLDSFPLMLLHYSRLLLAMDFLECFSSSFWHRLFILSSTLITRDWICLLWLLSFWHIIDSILTRICSVLTLFRSLIQVFWSNSTSTFACLNFMSIFVWFKRFVILTYFRGDF